MVFFAIGRMPVIKLNMEAIQILLTACSNTGYKSLRREASFFCCNHDRCAMRVVGADEMHFVTRHSLMAYPDISLDVFHDVTEVERRVSVGEGGSNEQLTGHVDALLNVRNKGDILTANSWLFSCRQRIRGWHC